MSIMVERSDLETVAFALDEAVSAVNADPVVLVNALEIVQTYLDNDGDENDTTEVSDSETNIAASGEEPVDPVADDDIPF